MRRFLASVVFLAAGVFAPVGIFACGSSSSMEAAMGPDAALRRDGGPVEPPDASPGDDAPPPPAVPSCEKYCELVVQSCAGNHAQYATSAECLGFCERFPEGKPGDADNDTLGCRASYAGSPAKTDPQKYCAAAGPFGGGLCGDRCTAFCHVAVSACQPDAGPYVSYPDCATACAGYAFRDAGAYGGGESPSGPIFGDTLNCRLYQLREIIRASAICSAIGPDSGPCR